MRLLLPPFSFPVVPLRGFAPSREHPFLALSFRPQSSAPLALLHVR